MRARGSAALLAMISVLAFAPAAQGAAGFPDPVFGNGGFATLDDPAGTNEQLHDVLVLPDGKILGGGGVRGASKGFLLARVNPNGTPDGGFGAGGIRVEPDTGSAGAPLEIADLALRPDGKILAAGLGRDGEGKNNAFEFARYLPDGALDPSFGAAGLTTVALSPSGTARAIAIAPDQKVIAVGRNGLGGEVVVVRLTENGEPDASFHDAPKGVRILNFPESTVEEARAVTVLGDGTILFGGSAAGVGVFLAELNSNGSPVAGFGAGGVAMHDLSAEGSISGAIEDIEVLDDGRILATGTTDFGIDPEIFVARFTPSGDLDPGFASGGVFRSNPTAGVDEAVALEVLPDGRILAAGQRGGEMGPGTGDTWLLRLSSGGQPDPSFGVGGEATASGGAGRDRAWGLALQQDGKAVIAGFADEPGSRLLLFGRFTADEPAAAPAPEPLRCRGREVTLIGTDQADRLSGTPGPDVILALRGNDRINTGGGNDVVCAGGGKDFIRTGRGADIVLGQAGPDSIFGGPGRDLLVGGPGADGLFGGTGSDRLIGGPGRRDFCNGGRGRDRRGRAGCERRKRIP